MLINLIIVIICVINASCYNEIEEQSSKPWEQSPFLPEDIIPQNYNIFLDPNIKEGLFNGRVKIDLNLKLPRNNLILNTKGLNITKTKLFQSNSTKEINIKDTFEYLKNEYWVVLFNDVQPAGNYCLEMTFNGNLTGSIVGFYRSKYDHPDGSTRYIVTTKFEPTYARQAFPCFDEPQYKATFAISLVKPSEGGYIALSNMNQINETANSPRQGVTTVDFAPTPLMSTYLACFIICDFEKLDSAISDSNTPITVYARSGQIENMKYARDLAVQTLNEYSKFFDIDYVLPKLDLIAIPDFVSGAMENWGLITFRETSVLIKDKVSSTLHYEAVAKTVCHELAHMWFGNLVTMAWWDDLWLNEGFASFLAAIFVEKIKPEFHTLESEVESVVQQVMNDDADISSHPIIQAVSHPDKITEMFDVISYLKGYSVLRMLNDFSADSFRDGIRVYLKKFKFKNAKTSDLWQSLQDFHERVDIVDLMDTWTRQEGYPLVTVSRNNREITLKQQRFLSDNSTEFDSTKSPYGYKWSIPVSYTESGNPRFIQNELFDRTVDEVTFKLRNDSTWYKLNWRQVGFYRVNYPLEDWKLIETTLKNNLDDLPFIEDRANLLDDSFNLAKAGYISYDVPLSLIEYLKSGQENQFVPWTVASKHLSNLKRKLTNMTQYDSYLKFAQSLVEPSYSDDLWNIPDNASFADVRLRLVKLNLACQLELPSALEKSREILNNWLEGKTEKPNHEIRSTVYRYGMRNVNNSTWEKMWQHYLNEKDPQEQVRLRSGVASIRNKSILERLLELTKNEDYVRTQDFVIMLSAISVNEQGNSIIWNFIRNDWEYLINRLTLNDRGLGRLIPVATSDFNTPEKLNEMKEFFAAYPNSGAGEVGRKHSLETAENNIKWINKYNDFIGNWLMQKL